VLDIEDDKRKLLDFYFSKAILKTLLDKGKIRKIEYDNCIKDLESIYLKGDHPNEN